jgi:hypothetical protein
MTKKERRMEIKSLQRKLNQISAERKFIWHTPKYQEAHISLLDNQEEKIQRKLEKIL